MLWWRSSCVTVAGPGAATRTKSPPPQPGLNAWTRYCLSRYTECLPTSALAWPRRRGFQWGHFKPMKSNGGAIFQSDNHSVLSLLSHHPCELLEVHEINLKIPFWIDGHTNTLCKARSTTTHDTNLPAMQVSVSLWVRKEQGRAEDALSG